MEEAIQNGSRFDYRPSAGMMTNKNPKFRRDYLDEYQGRQIGCDAHIGRGNKDGDPGSIRVYFCFDAITGKVVVSYCGNHLPNHTGQFIK